MGTLDQHSFCSRGYLYFYLLDYRIMDTKGQYPKIQDGEIDKYTDDPDFPDIQELKPVKDFLPRREKKRRAREALREIRGRVQAQNKGLSAKEVYQHAGFGQEVVEETLQSDKNDTSPSSSATDAYKALWAIKGIAKGKKADISSRIDEILYGKNGVWRGKKK
jgi:hypothetical protein